VNDFLLSYEAPVRLGCFLVVLAAMALWEHRATLRPDSQPRGRRWFTNLAMGVVDIVALRLTLPVLAVGVALVAESRSWGVFNWLEWPTWLAFLLSLLVLDLAIYAQHLVLHKVPLLWRLHRMHHSDLDFDASTALRFHPLEIILSMLFKMLLVLLLGAPAAAVLAFEVILNAMAMFNHGNVRIPPTLERTLRWLVVTPDMHRVHHSILRQETNSNFGFNLSWWDRVFGTYRATPQYGPLAMTIGLEQFRDPRWLSLSSLLVQPFVNTGVERIQPPRTEA
jgi:sterol desaturase/sphingolipid hydroxylase (fatty acid hydroxylase superfamily)